ncbi:MAG TPA: 50S ribosomal protein L10 [Actinomycetota bacterium]|nr:50S ribosomal protein L10 [Actinomycetota bacterium]
MARPDKVQEVQEITERFNGAQAALLTEYRGLTVGEIAEVRSALREANAEYRVLKNTLTRIAVREVGLEELVEMLTGPTAIAFIKGDAVDAARALDDAAKKFPVLVIKGGVLDGKIMDADQAKALAKLEPRDVQLTKIAIMLNAPIQQTVNVFAAMLRDLGSMLGQVLAQKETEAPVPAAEPEASAEPPEPEAAAEPETPAEEAPAAPEAEEQAAAAPEAEEATQPEATAEEVTEESEDSESKEE